MNERTFINFFVLIQCIPLCFYCVSYGLICSVYLRIVVYQIYGKLMKDL